MTDMEQPENREPDPQLSATPKRRVLVIDDDPPLRGMLSAALRLRGFQVLLAGNGREAQQALTLHRPNIILLDLMMPDVNGWDFLQMLSETGFRGQIPVIVMSAHLQIEPAAVLQMGVSALLPKPFQLPELMDLIEHLAP